MTNNVRSPSPCAGAAQAGHRAVDDARAAGEPAAASSAPRLSRAATTTAAAALPGSAAPPQRRAVIGVMGGMGPAAANSFGQMLIDLKHAGCDQDHARVLLDQATDIPDRMAAIQHGAESPVKRMQDSLRRLDRGGADLVAVPSNAAHHYFNDMQQAISQFGLKLEMLHVVDATMAEVERRAPGARQIGLLASNGTLGAQVYEKRSAQQGQARAWLAPHAATQQECVMAAIDAGAGAGHPARAQALLLAAARELHAAGAQAIVMADTTIATLLRGCNVRDENGRDVPLIDPLDALAKQALERAETQASRLDTRRGVFEIATEGLTHFVHSAAAFMCGTPERPRRVGVMGGMGPAAAMQFSHYMVSFNEAATTDQQHVPVLVDQATDIPDRTGAIISGGRDPAPEMVASLKRLAAAGADEVVMTCNTAHYFFPQVEAAITRDKLDVNMIHIVDATMKLLDARAPQAQRIGLLATTGTVQTGIYQQRAEGRVWMVPDEASQRDEVMAGIYGGVKAGNIEAGREALHRAAQALADQGADAILLACTEIPLVLQHGDIRNPAGDVVPLIDTLEAQARAAIARSRVPVPATPGLVQQVQQWLALRPPPVPAEEAV